MNKTTPFLVFILNLICIITMNAQEAEYAQYVKTTDIQDKELHQIVAEYNGKYYYCDDDSPLTSSHAFNSVETNKEDDYLLQMPPDVKNGFQLNSYSNGYRIKSYCLNKYCGLDDKGYLISLSKVEGLKQSLWTFSFQPNGQVNISIKKSTKTYTIVFNTDKKNFLLTTDVNQRNYTLPYIYKKQAKLVANITISNTLWTTFYSDYSVHIPNGVEVYTIKSIEENGLIKNNVYVASESNTLNLEKNTPVLLHSKEPGTYPLYESTDLDPLNPNNKFLHGTSTDQMIEAEDGYSYYMLTYGTINNEKVFGFFYGAENGGPFVNKGGKAYLAVPTTIANQALGFSLGTDDDKVTSIKNEHYNKKQSISSVTTLSGIRLNNTDKSKLPSGIYIIDGKKVFVK